MIRGFSILLVMVGGGCASLLGISEQDGLLQLDSLQVSAGTLQPAFDPQITDYTVDVTFDDAMVAITTHSAAASATVSIGGTPATSRNVAIPLGDTPVDIELASTSGVVATYTVRVRRPDLTLAFALPTSLQTNGSMVVSATLTNFDDDPNQVDIGLISLGGDVSLMINKGAMQFAQTNNDPLSGTRGIAAAQLDPDGHPDMIVSAGQQLLAAQGNGDGTFQPFFGQGSANQAGAFAVGQMTNDNLPDVAVVNGTNLIVLTGAAGGLLAGPATALGPNNDPRFVFAAQIDNQPGDDVVTLDAMSRKLVIFTNANNQGMFISRPVDLMNIGATALVVADFDGDQRGDLALLDPSNNQVVVMTRFPDLAPTVLAVLKPRAFAAGDLDGDGRFDLVVLDEFGFMVFHNTGTGFEGKQFALPPGEATVAIGDLNGDGRSDLVFTHFASTLTILLGKP